MPTLSQLYYNAEQTSHCTVYFFHFIYLFLFDGVVPVRLLTEISERPELLSKKNPVTIRKKHEKTW